VPPTLAIEVPYVGALSGLAAGDPIIAGIASGGSIAVNLRAVDFADPAGILALATACIDCRLYGRPVSVIAPYDANVANYLLRMRVRDVMRDYGVAFVGSFADRLVAIHPQPGRLLEFQSVRERDATRIGRQLRDLGRSVGIPTEVIERAWAGVAETLENVFEHSRRREAFLIAQRYTERRSGHLRLELAIGDLGVGLLSTLRTRYPVRTDEAAVQRAIQDGVSRYKGGRRGGGLYWVVRSATETGGLFHLRSGSARIRVAHGQDEPLVSRLGVSRDGVQIALSLRALAPG
jgi:hypothetical protein